ncbi:FG-GAP-like repeat-containing protein [Hyunsoonleella rubra]|uniref:FG-GAP-like repeat-containing protein n=1 Tax=Hyunsoonleella rubra TaxID=1737062 RepID=A0ABW5TCW2_9FLAO
MKRVIILLFLLHSNVLHLFPQQFKEISSEARLNNISKSNAISVADYDQDGLLDIFIVARLEFDENNPNSYSKLFKNIGNGSFINVTEDAKLNEFVFQESSQLETRSLGNKIGASWGDFNNDSYPDLFLSGVSFNHLFKNNRDGTFTEITASANIPQFCQTCTTTSSLWFDHNKDGYLDLFLTDYTNREPNRIYINNQDETFNLLESNVNDLISISYSSIPIDANNDGDLDIYVANDFDRNNFLFIKNNDNYIEDAQSYSLLDPFDGMGLATPDFNNDGLFDLFVTNINENGFYVNKGNGNFEDESETYGVKETEWAWGVVFADFDNDGYEDLYIANGVATTLQPNYYFKNVPSGNNNRAFENQSSNFSDFGRTTISKCIADFDFDNDGDLDLIVGDFESNLQFYENTLDGDNNWVKIVLEGTISNKNAFGSIVKLKSNNNNQQRLYHGSRFLSQSVTPVHFGIEKASTIDEISVKWPNGLEETYFNIPANNTILLTENEGITFIDNTDITPIFGCTDVNACNYNSEATQNDNSCTYLTGPSITGTTTPSPLSIHDYTVPSDIYSQYEWTVENGSLISEPNSNSISIEWGIADKGTVRLVAQDGDCSTQEVNLSVDISYAPSTTNKHSVARLWNEVLLEAIRNDFARPTVHARNLFHTSIAMYDAWALYNLDTSTPYFSDEYDATKIPSFDNEEEKLDAQVKTISYAVYNILKHRFRNSPKFDETSDIMEGLMLLLELNPSNTKLDYSDGDPIALGNYIASRIIDFGLSDGANETNDYGNQYYSSINPALVPYEDGNSKIVDGNRWQPLLLDVFIDQSGNLVTDNTAIEFLSPEWGNVVPFSLNETLRTELQRNGNNYKVYHDPGPPPYLSLTSQSAESDAYKWGNVLVSVWGAHLDPADNVLWDISPASIGNINSSLFPENFSGYPNFYNLLEGGDIGTGRSINPITNAPYPAQMVPRGDYARVLAEFWADGPDSETPPGHWFTILNYVSDHPDLDKRIMGEGETLDNLEWDVKSYFILGGGMHDSAIAAWSVKGWYDYVRPISAIRYMAENGQSTDPSKSNYNIGGIPLIEGYIELVEAGDPLEGNMQENIGKIKLYTWRGHDFINDPKTDTAGVGWILAEDWWPYQRPSFVTPPFAGFVSGHSTYSRAAAEIMTLITGDEYFPGGVGEFIAKKNEFLVFEEGPSVDVKLQWATYRDASDQCSLSRIWGGIHPPADDIPGRLIGEKIGKEVVSHALPYFSAKQINQEGEVKIYPNPISEGVINISNTQPTDNFTLFDIRGGRIEIENVQYDELSRTTRIDLPSSIASGVYIISINSSAKLIVCN